MSTQERNVVCIGGADLDRKYHLHQSPVDGTSNPADCEVTVGGVARNVATNLALLGIPVRLVTTVGNDPAGSQVVESLRAANVGTDLVYVSADRSTAEYVAVVGPDGDLVLGVAHMDIYETLTPKRLEPDWSGIADAALVFADCNLPSETLCELIRRRQSGEFLLAIDAVSVPKVSRLPGSLDGVDLLFVNLDEANELLRSGAADRLDDVVDAALAVQQRGAATVVVTNGKGNVAIASPAGSDTQPVLAATPVDTTGAGDATIAGTLFGLLAGRNVTESLQTGLLMAALTIESRESVRPDMSAQLLNESVSRRAGFTTGD